nr:hypothetical protein [Tanacetum cinerariifolium]
QLPPLLSAVFALYSPMVPVVFWEVMEGRGGVVRNGRVGQKTREKWSCRLGGKLGYEQWPFERGRDEG